MPKGRKSNRGKAQNKQKATSLSGGTGGFTAKGARGGTFFTPTHLNLISLVGSSSLLATPTSLDTDVTSKNKVNKRKSGKSNSNNSKPSVNTISVTSGPTATLLRNALAATASPRLRKLPYFSPSDAILLVGEGDFSFAAALAKALDYSQTNSSNSGSITATSFDSYSEVSGKYSSEATARIAALKILKRVFVLHKLDATRMAADPRIMPPRDNGGPAHLAPIHTIVFNFPHIGGGTQRDTIANKRMLLAFFKQSQILLATSFKNANNNTNNNISAGKIKSKNEYRVLVALRSTPFYEKFGLEEVAVAAGFSLLERVLFDADRWTALGYISQRTNPAQRDAPSCENADLYVFNLDSELGYVTKHVDGLDTISESANEEIPVVAKKIGRKQRKEMIKSGKYDKHSLHKTSSDRKISKKKGPTVKIKWGKEKEKNAWPGKITKKDSWKGKKN
ncbi:hypothetical protein HK100_009586 [Physocladia obscura]|uniref:25S rRNA (uridine-N(3))-methyltransferase BMT5-like domain-containing protein n=1 Tax=Physocladia obscura TaxID=109957 RepID=A0AAD5XJ84_9FUNG|nr:hypothetical protein HK100_009586 [Physocladia obscura]